MVIRSFNKYQIGLGLGLGLGSGLGYAEGVRLLSHYAPTFKVRLETHIVLSKASMAILHHLKIDGTLNHV